MNDNAIAPVGSKKKGLATWAFVCSIFSLFNLLLVLMIFIFPDRMMSVVGFVLSLPRPLFPLIFIFQLATSSLPIVGLILAIMSYIRIRREPEVYGGRVLTIISLVISGLYIIFPVGLILLAVFAPSIFQKLIMLL